jgi:hypothetical protein
MREVSFVLMAITAAIGAAAISFHPMAEQQGYTKATQ